MRTLDTLILKSFVPVFVYALLFFVLILQLVDLFEYILTYLNREIPTLAIAQVQLMYLPQTLVFAMPPAILFATSFTLGSLYAGNELISVFGAGQPLRRFVLPLMCIGLAAGGFLFWFEDSVSIESTRLRNDLQRSLVGTGSLFRTNTIVSQDAGRLVFFTEYYARSNDTMDRVTVVERDADGEFVRRISARGARWHDGRWILDDALVFERANGGSAHGSAHGSADDSTDLTSARHSEYTQENFTISPEIFRRGSQEIGEMTLDEARRFIDQRLSSGLPARQARTQYYSRYAFAVTPFIVTLFATAVGSRLKKSVLLLSLLLSLILSVVYYVAGMILGLLAQFGYIPPVIGAFAPAVIFLAVAVALLFRART